MGKGVQERRNLAGERREGREVETCKENGRTREMGRGRGLESRGRRVGEG